MELFWRDVVKRLRPSFLYWLENIKSDPSDDPYDLFARRPLSIKLLALSSNITILSVHSRYLDACQYQRPSFGLSSEISFEHSEWFFRLERIWVPSTERGASGVGCHIRPWPRIVRMDDSDDMGRM
jgi:hypothetical protein